jgi:hypothetical protein
MCGILRSRQLKTIPALSKAVISLFAPESIPFYTHRLNSRPFRKTQEYNSMALTLPNLDDHTFDDLVAEGKTLIPRYAPDWTNHNASDPGITLLELFAYLTEILLYRTNRITDAHRNAFLGLLIGPCSDSPGLLSQERLTEAISHWRHRIDRAVTCADYENLAKAADPDRIARAQYSLLRSAIRQPCGAARPSQHSNRPGGRLGGPK